jgi:alpha-tubulin suppressor-like RCC1 family protein
MVKSVTGRVYVFGANHQGQLGLGDLVDRLIPIDIDGHGGMDAMFSKDPVADVAAKGTLSIILTNSGKALMFGDAADAQYQQFRRPSHIHVIPKGEFISAVECTSNRCYALSDVGRIYRWSVRDINLVPEASALEPFHAISGVFRLFCGAHHMAVLCTISHGLTATMMTRQKVGEVAHDISAPNKIKEADEASQVALKVMPEFLDDFDGGSTSESPSREGDGYVMTYGKGLDGRLGHGLTYSLSEASKLKPAKVEKLSKNSICFIGCGKDSTFAISDTGRLFTWGNQQFGKLGLNHSHSCMSVPMQVSTLTKFNIVLCSMGRNHSLCLSDKGNLFAWGSNTFGQLGLEGVTASVSTPQEVPTGRDLNIRHLACGGFHSLLCSWTFEIFTCGKGWHGQLGQGDYESLTAQSKTLPYFKKIAGGLGAGYRCVRVFGGTESSAALTEDGAIFTWGQGSQCQLGHNGVNNESKPRKVERLSKDVVVDVAMGKSHSVALDAEGRPWTWGKGNNGQLGISEKGDKERLPRPVELCRRAIPRAGMIGTSDEEIPWGSVYYMREKDEKGIGEVDKRIVENNGKVIQVSATNPCLFLLVARIAAHFPDSFSAPWLDA